MTTSTARSMHTVAVTKRVRAPRRADADVVLQALEAMCASLQPGDPVPTHTVLMQRFNASERTILRALDDLRREGKIVRRHGVGTFVGERSTRTSQRDEDSFVPAVVADSRTIVAIATPDQGFFDRAIGMLFRQTEEAGLSLACRLIDPTTRSLPPLNDIERPLGYLLFRQDLMPLAQQLQDAGARVVVVGAPYVDVTPHVPNVHGDHEAGGYLATNHLLQLGHQRIAYMGWPYVQQTWRWRGHERALYAARRSGKTVQASMLPQDEVEMWRTNLDKAKAYFQRPDAPTGIVAWSDYEALMLLGLLARIGVRVPEDVSIVGYDDLPEGRLVHPTLTTVDSAIAQLLQAALKVLNQLTPLSPSHTEMVLPQLICRDSSAQVSG